MVTQPSREATLPLPGEKIAGKYEVVRMIGEGGMGLVYEAIHVRLQQRVAIKLLQPRVLCMPEVVARFEREARAACRLKSRNAVRILDVDHTSTGLAYMVMEYLEGRDLSEELTARVRLRPAEAVDFVLQACAAMAEAHASGVIHRDLKPSNLFLVPEGDRIVVKVLDFGISKMTTEADANVTSTFATMGTPLYMSPEQIRSTKNVDARTDIWALGVILYEALAGERPFSGTLTAAAAAIVADPPPPMRERVDLPEGLERVVLTALAKAPEDRFADVRSFAEALAPYGSDLEPLRQMRAEAAPVPQVRAGTTGPRPQSTPSFVHAPTVAHVTPPQGPQERASAPPSGVPSGVVPAHPTTAGAWSTQGTERRSASRRRAIVALTGVAGVVAAVAIGWALRSSVPGGRRGGDEGPAQPTADRASTAAAPVSAPASAPVSALAAPATPSAAASAVPTISATPSAMAPAAASVARPHGPRAEPRAPHATPAHSAPAATTAAPAPTTNPLHL